MNVSIEISLYPLDHNYVPPIIDFIDRCKKHSSLTIQVQPMSTLITGNYDVIMDILKVELKTTFAQNLTSVGVIKIVNLDLIDR